MKRAAIYVRVSTDDQRQHGLSIDSQLIALQEYCKKNHYIIAGIYNDAGISARKSYKKRPGLLQMIEDCQNNKIDIVLFTKLDRFFRSVKDYYACIDQMNDVPWKCIWEDYETETSNGMLKVNIMLSVAQSEADKTSERVKKVVEFKQNRGDYIGSAPTGYKLNKRELIIDDSTEELMKDIFNTYLKTFSIKTVQEFIKEKYNRPYAAQSIRKMLKNPTYSGSCKNGYKCQPYITKDQYELIIDNINKKRRPAKYPNMVYLFSGLLTCEICGRRISAHSSPRNLKNETIIYKRYHCEKSRGNAYHEYLALSEYKLEDYLVNSLDKLYELSQMQIKSINMHLITSKNLIAKRDKLNAKLKRLAVLFEDGLIDHDEYVIKRDNLKEEINTIRVEPIPLLKPLPENWQDMYKNLDDVHKKQFWNNVIKEIIITKETRYNPKVIFR